jgi:hypothetical protein
MAIIKKKEGPPFLYTDEVIEKKIIPGIYEFMSQQNLTEYKAKTRIFRGESVTMEEEVGGLVPTLHRACKFVKVNQSTMYELIKRNHKLAKVIEELRQLEHEFVVQNAVRGYYKEAFSRFILINISSWSDAAKLRVDPQSLTDEDLIMYAKTALGLLEKEKVFNADRSKKTK